MKYIIKRNGEKKLYISEKIRMAILPALEASGEGDESSAGLLMERIDEILAPVFASGEFPAVEDIQDTVVRLLFDSGFHTTAELYRMYRENQERKRVAFAKEERCRRVLEGDAGFKSTEADDSKTRAEEIRMGKGEGPLAEAMNEVMDELRKIAEGLCEPDVASLLDDAIKRLPKECQKSDLDAAVLSSVRNAIERNADYGLLAARILIYKQAKRLLRLEKPMRMDGEEYCRRYREGFLPSLEKGVSEELLDPALLTQFDLQRIKKALSPERDLYFQYPGMKTLTERYLLHARRDEGDVFELPQYFWMRVSMGLACKEVGEEKTIRAIEFYELLSELRFVPSTPTLFNSGTLHPQLSSCFTGTVSDSLENIFQTYSDSASLSKYAGGVGIDWTGVRSLGAPIKGTNGKSQGVIPFLKIFNDVAVAVNQGGKRKGALAAYLEVWHGDLEAFLEAKKNTGDERRRLHDIHTALWIPDLFMKRVREKGSWTLFSPSEVPDLHDLYGKEFEKQYEIYESMELPTARTHSAENLWRKILSMLFETGHPWITFKDPCNIRSPQDHAGVVRGSNLCTEITLNSSEEETAVCNLGSLHLARLVGSDRLNGELLRSAVRTAVRILDNVIDINYYPTESAKRSNLRHRAVGLGVMGYQEALYSLKIPFGSPEQLEFADRSMERISYFAIEASADLAKERGTYESYEGSKWSRGIFPLDTMQLLEKERGEPIPVDRTSTMDWDSLREKVRVQGMRNSNLMAIAPTATISNIAGTTASIEPSFRNLFVKENVDGSFLEVNRNLQTTLHELGLWSEEMIGKIRAGHGSIQGISEIPEEIRKLYETSFDLDPLWILHAAARRGKWIDQSASLNLFIHTTSGKALSDLYMEAYRLGLKTTYYLRSLSATSLRSSTSGEKMTALPVSPAKRLSLSHLPISAEESCRANEPDCEVCQ